MTVAEVTHTTHFEPIPSLDVLGDQAVRLVRGDFDRVTRYGDPIAIAASWNAEPGTRLHVVDLEGARSGRATQFTVIDRLARLGFRVQVGGGVRSAEDALRCLDAGAEKVVVGTAAAAAPDAFRSIANAAVSERVIAAVDVRDGRIRTDGWTRASDAGLDDVISFLESVGIAEMLVTDIQQDGMLAGPSFDLYRRLGRLTSMRLIASGGVATSGDIASLSRIDGVSGVVIGKALHEGRLTLEAAKTRARIARSFCDRIIPCLDVQGGRVVKGTQFVALRDAGDPVELARMYEAEGADELVVLDISATAEERRASLDLVRRVADSLFIPLTVGGGVRSLDDFGRLIHAGADRVAINTAAVERPGLISECAAAFGAQAVVLACDTRRDGGEHRVVVRSGAHETPLEAAAWCRKAESLGAGEILLTSIDRDGTRGGFDLELLRQVTAALQIGVIASGGGGEPRHFADALEIGGARAVLAAAAFHDRSLSIREVKQYLAQRGVPVR